MTAGKRRLYLKVLRLSDVHDVKPLQVKETRAGVRQVARRQHQHPLVHKVKHHSVRRQADAERRHRDRKDRRPSTDSVQRAQCQEVYLQSAQHHNRIRLRAGVIGLLASVQRMAGRRADEATVSDQ